MLAPLQYEKEQDGRRQRPLGDHQLRNWYGSTAAKVKTAMVYSQEDYKSLLDDFLPEFGCLGTMMWEWRDLLFPLKADGRFIGTPDGHSPVYNGVISMFDKQISGN